MSVRRGRARGVDGRLSCKYFQALAPVLLITKLELEKRISTGVLGGVFWMWVTGGKVKMMGDIL